MIDIVMKVGCLGVIVGWVGLLYDVIMDMVMLFYCNIVVVGGLVFVIIYDKDLFLKVVLDGKINLGKVFIKIFILDEINDVY